MLRWHNQIVFIYFFGIQITILLILLPVINVLLTGEAEEWPQATLDLCRLLERPTEEGNETFLGALRDQFPEQTVTEKVSCEAELAKLVQEDKDLAEYCQAGVETLRHQGIKDQVASSSMIGRKPETLLLETVVNKWIRGLKKTRTRIKLMKVSSDLPTLQAAYNRARNVEKAERELREGRGIPGERRGVSKVEEIKYAEFQAAYAKQVCGVEEEEEEEERLMPENLFEKQDSRNQRANRQGFPKSDYSESCPPEQNPEGPDGRKSNNDFVNGRRDVEEGRHLPLVFGVWKAWSSG
ncbi:hypothetical protein BDDG_06484 [Blastomyces dermatitidis ATCC 18188]|uniref:Retrotransposon gag domain-containing protein n=1 Tax=Ajellomyces dermatitidis (strain ATCC 18188 / CBS 674.68) TaxID=653446 RepID=F2TJX7_AJEDA|nr:hypothetical protein BDDG_06484 [Blastomyces dermatitidis ATCC 18188]EQL31558.1 hypothetical protein BDFG_06134 [Blastomyces dermatitidis ATCC 26199]